MNGKLAYCMNICQCVRAQKWSQCCCLWPKCRAWPCRDVRVGYINVTEGPAVQFNYPVFNPSSPVNMQRKPQLFNKQLYVYICIDRHSLSHWLVLPSLPQSQSTWTRGWNTENDYDWSITVSVWKWRMVYFAGTLQSLKLISALSVTLTEISRPQEAS
jgi:hypothetical protein